MSIQTITRQKPAHRPQFNPALVKPITFQMPELALKPPEPLRFDTEDSQQNSLPTSAHLDALRSNFEEQAKPPTPTVPEEANTDLRADLKDWLPVYAPYLDLASLEALS